jgi:hypothetical protein
MMMRRRLRHGLSHAALLALGLSAVLAVWGYIRMNSNAAAMHTASRDLRECRNLVAEIVALRELPPFAALDADSPGTIRQRIDQASQTARLPEGSLVRIQPQPPYQLGNSEYRLWSTRLELSNVTLQELTTFSHALVDEDRGTTVRDLRIWSSSNDSTAGTPEPWSAEITLTQVTFFPTSRAF